MKISTGTIDCWLSVSGPNNNSDFQHHHWDIGPSGTIDSSLTNTPTYTWNVNANGYWAGNGSWSTPLNQSLTSNAQVRISSPGTVSLRQTHGFGVNHLPATGNQSTAHAVSELMWPQDANGGTLVNWPNAGMPSMSTYQDMGPPTYQFVMGPPFQVAPTGETGPLSVVGICCQVIVSFLSLVLGARIGFTRRNFPYFLPPVPVHGGRGPSILFPKPRAVFRFRFGY